jgi:acetolactate synthase regulatory subunit
MNETIVNISAEIKAHNARVREGTDEDKSIKTLQRAINKIADRETIRALYNKERALLAQAQMVSDAGQLSQFVFTYQYKTWADERQKIVTERQQINEVERVLHGFEIL